MKPILFSTPMVQAILNGNKTQTRRVIKPQPAEEKCYGVCTGTTGSNKNIGKIGFGNGGNKIEFVPVKYSIEDILWVRETWCTDDDMADVFEEPLTHGFYYKADCVTAKMDWVNDREIVKWRPSIFMPREAARIFLRVTDVKVERVQDITAEDVITEGLPANNEIRNSDSATHESIKSWNLAYAQHLFRELWDSINKSRGYSFASNPYVWVISFEYMKVINDKFEVNP